MSLDVLTCPVVKVTFLDSAVVMGLYAEVVATGVGVVATWTEVEDVATEVSEKGSESDSGCSIHVSDTVLTGRSHVSMTARPM